MSQSDKTSAEPAPDPLAGQDGWRGRAPAAPMAPIGPVSSPHRTLARYYADEQQRRRYVRRIFDETAADYDRIERILAFGSGGWYRGKALGRAGVRPGAAVLDVGCGTGLLAREALVLAGPRGRVVGVDPSPGMLALAGLDGADLVVGSAESLPVADATFDFVTMGYALRHVGDLGQAFKEFHRVLRPGGAVLILEITRPASAAGTALLKTYMRGVVPLIARAVSRGPATPELWRYFWDTIEACVPPQRVLDTLLTAGFTRVSRQVGLGLFSEFQALKPLAAPGPGKVHDGGDVPVGFATRADTLAGARD